MLNRKIIYFFLLFHAFPPGNKSTSHEPSFLIKLINHVQAPSNRTVGRSQKPTEVSPGDLKCNDQRLTANELPPKFVGRVQARFIDQGFNDSSNGTEMEAPSAKLSIFNLLSGAEEGDDEDLENDDGDENVKDEDGGDDDFNFFGGDEEVNGDELEGTKDEAFLKQYHRHRFRFHNLLFPLLLAYKLKFFTVIPLLLGSLVLLVGTTGVAGFFFALFAAALAIHSKAHAH